MICSQNLYLYLYFGPGWYVLRICICICIFICISGLDDMFSEFVFVFRAIDGSAGPGWIIQLHHVYLWYVKCICQDLQRYLCKLRKNGFPRPISDWCVSSNLDQDDMFWELSDFMADWCVNWSRAQWIIGKEDTSRLLQLKCGFIWCKRITEKQYLNVFFV